VRSPLLIAVLLLAVGAVAATFEAPPVAKEARPVAPIELDWVRTTEGWQRPMSWEPAHEPTTPVHPSVVASLVLMASIAALIACPPRPS